jgi:hypothetical protein
MKRNIKYGERVEGNVISYVALIDDSRISVIRSKPYAVCLGKRMYMAYVRWAGGKTSRVKPFGTLEAAKEYNHGILGLT